MSSFFDQSSLCLIPSGYKDQKVYSVKPIDGSGDLTFSRASNATRVNSSGLVEKVRTNLAFPSENFSAWTQKNGATTINTTANPIDGAITADTFVSVAQVGQRSGYELPFSTAVGELTASNYFKYVNNQWIFLAIYDTNNATYRTAAFDIQNGVAGVTSSGATSSIISVGGGWYRCSITYPISSSTTTYHSQGILNGNVLGVVCNTSGGESFISFGAQYENGVTTDYIATTSAAVSVGPVSGLPRLDYSGGASCPSLLLEPQRTNVITNNNNFVTGASNVTVTANNATSPEGYQNADLITGNAGTLTKVVNFNGASAGQYTVSVFAKYNTQQWIQLGAGGIASFANFDIQNGVVGTTNVTSSIEDYGNGWYRCSMVMVSGTPLSHYVGIITNGTSARLSTTASTGSFWAYGIQSELGNYPTSVIPTLSSAVTRVADTASKTGISSLIGQTEGTIFLDIKPFNTGPNVALRLSDGTNNNRITFEWSGAKVPYFVVGSGGALQVYQSVTCALNTQHKIAIGYKANDFVIYIDGVLAGSDTSGSVPSSLSEFRFGETAGFDFNGEVNQALLFKTRLSNADLATLTA